jgi:DNA (cytosine-5)-methyltransferase 1
MIAPYYSKGRAYPASEPMRTVSTVDRSGVIEPLLVPTEGRPGKEARPVSEPARTQTCRRETGLAIAPFVATLRGGGSAKTPRTTQEPFTTVTGGGYHHLLAEIDERSTPRRMDIDLDALPPLIAEIDRIEAEVLKHPDGPERSAVKAALNPFAVRAAERMVDAGLGDLQFRMLSPAETARTMSFRPDFKVTGSKRDQVLGFGNAVTPPVSECIVSALVEVITGEELERSL